MLVICRYFDVFCPRFMHTQLNGVESIEVVSARSSSSDSNSATSLLVDFPDPLREWPSDDKLDLWWASCGGELFSNADRHYLRQPLCGTDLISIFITYLFPCWYCRAHFSILAFRNFSFPTALIVHLGRAEIPVSVPSHAESILGALPTNVGESYESSW